MFKVLATAVVMANLLFFSRHWLPARGKGLYQGLRGGMLGCFLACSLALFCSWLAPGPYRLSIYTLGFNLLLTPTLATAGAILGIGIKPKPVPAAKKKKAVAAFTAKTPPVETPAFSEVLAEVAGSPPVACEGSANPTNIEE